MLSTIARRHLLILTTIQRLLKGIIVRIITLNLSSLGTRMARVIKGIGNISVSGRIVMRLMSSLFSVSFMN